MEIVKSFSLKIKVNNIAYLLMIVGWSLSDVSAQQVNISRIEMMPNMPSPYELRDWKQVAIGYDSIVFDLNRTGQYLPLSWRNTNTVNYPDHDSFGLETVVGTPRQNFSEAINVLPAVIGASLVGIDKSNQNGENWVLMCQEYFNRRSEENIYLNHPVAQSGDDWWYETMPNVFFYQLSHLYPNTGDFAYQFTTVAEQWSRAVEAMGGSATPWQVPFMNYRAWSFSTMMPLNSGVREPEAAGAIAWLLYNAYVETGEEKYGIGAEWAMEFLNSRSSNPAYELQLAYGVYTAARMNAEFGTNYNVEKMVNWCFDIGPLRSWGAILGTWGGYDVHGLIGEVSGNDYAFLMNGFEQVGALVPMTRYDDRFTRAIGKWVLNIANASRLFYPNYLPPENQDSEEWSYQYDPNSYIGHEAMRKELFNRSPFATGDAVSGGWGFTNLVLYGSSHVGIMGGIIDTTNVKMILKLDMLKTDYFRDEAYPTYLYFNPYTNDKIVQLDVGSGVHDLYDAVSNSFLATGVSGSTSITIPGDQAVQLVIAPSGGTVTYDLDRMLIDGVVVDYRSGQNVSNYPPRIKSLATDPDPVFLNKSATIYCTAEDIDGQPLTYSWSVSAGSFTTQGATVIWIPPDNAGTFEITCIVDDGSGGTDSSTVMVEVLDNYTPVITGIFANPSAIDVGETTTLTCLATDQDGDSLTYIWNAEYGILSGSGTIVSWMAPSTQGYYSITCLVEDSQGAQAFDSVAVVVGGLVGYYPFSGNANDESGFNNHGTVSGAILVADRFGNPNSAYAFDGVNDFVRIPVHPSLNYQEAISVNFWMKVTEFFPREAFPISHGSWQNRWKVSIIPDKRLRWTVKTDSGIIDLDSRMLLVADSLYNVNVTYGNGEVKIYFNGFLNVSTTWSGTILKTNIDLTVGQILPGNNQYNFRGEIDDVRIYNYVLSEQEIQELYHLPTAIGDLDNRVIPKENRLYSNYPNPFNPGTTIRYDISKSSHVVLKVFNLLGQEVRTLVDQNQIVGAKQVKWDGRDYSGKQLASGIYLYVLRAENFVYKRKMILLR